MARFRSVALYVYLGLVALIGLARLEPHLTVRFSPVTIEDAPPVVNVVGAVRHPGVYRLPAGARVADALKAAGGPLPEADLGALDLAAPVGDAETLRVPTHRQPAAQTLGTPPERVSVNRASAAELEKVPGIGSKLARRIIAYRPYRSLDELVKVPGIGPRSLERLRPYLKP
ncbi:helix-hairpin-helix domain-containing protein [Oceanithermus sp.]